MTERRFSEQSVYAEHFLSPQLALDESIAGVIIIYIRKNKFEENITLFCGHLLVIFYVLYFLARLFAGQTSREINFALLPVYLINHFSNKIERVAGTLNWIVLFD